MRMVRGAAARNKRLRTKKGARGEPPFFAKGSPCNLSQSGPRSANEMAVVRATAGSCRRGYLRSVATRQMRAPLGRRPVGPAMRPLQFGVEPRFGDLLGDLFL